MKKPASGNVSHNIKKNYFESFVPATWNYEKKRKSIGCFPTHELAQSAIQLYRSEYVKDDEVLPCINFNPPGKIISRREVVQKQRDNGVYICMDCAIEFTELTDKRIRCADCVKKDRKESWIPQSELTEEQVEKRKQSRKKYNQSEKGIQKNQERIQSETYQERIHSEAYQEKLKEWSKRYRHSEIGKAKRREFMRKWKEIPENRISANIGTVLNDSLKGEYKSQHTIKYTGLNSGEELMTYLETLFTEGMTRENYGIPKDGTEGWAVDHIIPRKCYDHSDEEEIFKCWNYRNLQPMWMTENSSKGCNLTAQMFDIPVEYWPKSLLDDEELFQ